MQHRRDRLWTVLCLRSGNERLPLGRIQRRRVHGGTVEQIREQLRDLARGEICVIERGVSAEREHGVLEIDADDGPRLLREVLAGRLGGDGGGEDEALEGAEADAVCEADEVEVAEDVVGVPVEGVSEAVGESSELQGASSPLRATWLFVRVWLVLSFASRDLSLPLLRSLPSSLFRSPSSNFVAPLPSFLLC